MKLIEYLRKQGFGILEIINQNFMLILYSCILSNMIIISIVMYKQKIFLAFVFFISLLIILSVERLLKLEILSVYDKAHKKVLFLNLILLVLNIINIFFNVFRYLFYDTIKFVREYCRTILLNYFKIEIASPLDFYIDNVVAYVSFNVVWFCFMLSIFLMKWYFTYTFFDWSRKEYLENNPQVRNKMFWVFRHQNVFPLYFVTHYYMVSFILIPMIIDKYLFKVGFVNLYIASTFFLISFVFNATIYVQFHINYVKFYWKNNNKWKE